MSHPIPISDLCINVPVHSLLHTFSLGSVPVQISIATLGSPERAAVIPILEKAYSRFYASGYTGPKVSFSIDTSDYVLRTYTLVATSTLHNGQPFVLGTMKVSCHRDLQVFRLFEPLPGHRWPHEADVNLQPGEISRFALHEIFKDSDAFRALTDIPVNRARVLVSHELYAVSLALMKAHGVTTPYLILARHIAHFMYITGVRAVRVDTLQPGTSIVAHNARLPHSRYWRPQSPVEQQPAVYIVS